MTRFRASRGPPRSRRGGWRGLGDVACVGRAAPAHSDIVAELVAIWVVFAASAAVAQPEPLRPARGAHLTNSASKRPRAACRHVRGLRQGPVTFLRCVG